MLVGGAGWSRYYSCISWFAWLLTFLYIYIYVRCLYKESSTAQRNIMGFIMGFERRGCVFWKSFIGWLVLSLVF